MEPQQKDFVCCEKCGWAGTANEASFHSLSNSLVCPACSQIRLRPYSGGTNMDFDETWIIKSDCIVGGGTNLKKGQKYKGKSSGNNVFLSVNNKRICVPLYLVDKEKDCGCSIKG